MNSYKFGVFIRRCIIVVVILCVLAAIGFGIFLVIQYFNEKNRYNSYNNSYNSSYNSSYNDSYDDDDDDYYNNDSYNSGHNNNYNNNYNDNYNNDSYNSYNEYTPTTEPETEAPTTEPETEAPEDDTKYMVCTVDTLRIRSQPNTNCTIVGRIHKGNKIKVIGMENSEWCIVEYKGAKAYCAVEYLKES